MDQLLDCQPLTDADLSQIHAWLDAPGSSQFRSFLKAQYAMAAMEIAASVSANQQPDPVLHQNVLLAASFLETMDRVRQAESGTLQTVLKINI